MTQLTPHLPASIGSGAARPDVRQGEIDDDRRERTTPNLVVRKANHLCPLLGPRNGSLNGRNGVGICRLVV